MGFGLHWAEREGEDRVKTPLCSRISSNRDSVDVSQMLVNGNAQTLTFLHLADVFMDVLVR